MNVVLLTSDLMLISAAQGAARLVGATVVATAAGDDATKKCVEASARVLVIDLRLAALDLQQVVNQARNLAIPPTIIACGPHVHAQRLAAARDAGCDEVITRGEFESRIGELLAASAGQAENADQ